MKLPDRPVLVAYVCFPDGRRLHVCGCIDVPDQYGSETGWRPLLLCATHKNGRRVI